MNQQLNYQGLYPNPNASNGRDVHSQESYQGNIPCPLLSGDRWRRYARCDFPELREQLSLEIQNRCSCFGPDGNECVLRYIFSMHALSNGNDGPLNVVRVMGCSKSARDTGERSAMRNNAFYAVSRFSAKLDRAKCKRVV